MDKKIDPRLAELRKIIRQSRYSDEVNAAISTNIRDYRIKRKLTQKALADVLGLKQPHIARMERANHSRYTIKSLSKIALALGVTVDKLVKRVDKVENIK